MVWNEIPFGQFKIQLATATPSIIANHLKCKQLSVSFSFSFFIFVSSPYSFQLEDASNIINVNRNKQNPFDYDQVNLICPYYTKGATRTDEPETYIIYNVSLTFRTWPHDLSWITFN